MNSTIDSADLSEEELYWTQKLIPPLEKTLGKIYHKGETKRFFHPKMHGLVFAEFMVEPNLAPDLKVGLFAEAKTFPAWIRFSNASHRIKDDRKKNTFGFAIKLMDVPGAKVFPQLQSDTHDFILVDSETLSAPSLKVAGEAVLALIGNIFVKLRFLFMHFSSLLKSMKKTPCLNVLTNQYWSQVPSAFGSETKAVKYSVIPHQLSSASQPVKPSIDFLRAQLTNDLAADTACFDFCVQFQTNAEAMPIENPSVKWTSPMVKLATIRIPKQTFDTAEQRKFAEGLAYNPWHCLPSHVPLGGISKVRREVYRALSAYRHERNNREQFEPTLKSFQPTLR